MKQIIYITLHMDMSRYRILLRCLTPAMPDAFWSTVGGGSSHRSFDDWWTTLPDEFKKIPYKMSRTLSLNFTVKIRKSLNLLNQRFSTG
jgi:hypothetical protein